MCRHISERGVVLGAELLSVWVNAENEHPLKRVFLQFAKAFGKTFPILLVLVSMSLQ
jgi:hypothetical protein